MTIALIIAHPYSASSQLADVLLAVACHLVFITPEYSLRMGQLLLGTPCYSEIQKLKPRWIPKGLDLSSPDVLRQSFHLVQYYAQCQQRG